MTPPNLTIVNSVREYQKHFNQAFNVASASQSDLVYSSTQTIAGRLIVCRSFTVNAAVVLTISNPTTIVCETFRNDGTITMSQVSESTLGKYRTTDAPVIPETRNWPEASVGIIASAASGNTNFAGCGGPSFGYGGATGKNGPTNLESFTAPSYGVRSELNKGWTYLGCPMWWPVAYFRNPVLSGSAGNSLLKPHFATSLAFQRAGQPGVQLSYSTGHSPTQQATCVVGANPGSFLEIFARTSATNTGTINVQGATGGAGSATIGSSGGGGGGCLGVYSEGTITFSGTVNANGGAGNTASNLGSGGGGGGAIFYAAPTCTITATNNVAGGAAGGGSLPGQAGGAGIVVTEPYLRLWMPGEDDVVEGTRYSTS